MSLHSQRSRTAELICAALSRKRPQADTDRENDEAWPKKNIVGRQELEVRIDRDHISFEVSSDLSPTCPRMFMGAVACWQLSFEASGVQITRGPGPP